MLNDNSPMPFGKYKGTAMANVPASYLIWFRQNIEVDGRTLPIHQYIAENLDAIELECNNNSDEKNTSYLLS